MTEGTVNRWPKLCPPAIRKTFAQLMSSFADLLRPRDSDALRAELRGLAAETGVPVLFGGEVHDRDGPVIGEGFRSVLAVRVVVAGRARAVLYGAARGVGPLGDRTAELMIR